MKEFKDLGKKAKSKEMKTAKITRKTIASSKGGAEKSIQKMREKIYKKTK